MRCTVWGLVVVLLAVDATPVVIDFDAPSWAGSQAFTYSREYLLPSGGVPQGFFPVGDLGADEELLTRASIGEARWLLMEGPIWIRYDLNEHLVFRGMAPRLISKLPVPGDPLQSLFPAGLAAWNAGTFATDGFLLFEYVLPDGTRLDPIHDTPTVELDLKGVLATSGRGDGVVRVRAFEKAVDAAQGQNPEGLDKRRVVAAVAHSVRVVPKPVRQRAKATSGFLQFGVGDRVPLGGFEVVIDADHRQPNGQPVSQKLADLNVDIEDSRLTFSSTSGFGFAPAKNGWTVEQVNSRTGLCHGDADAAEGDSNATPPVAPNASRTVHPVAFGPEHRDHPAGPATTGVTLGTWHLCATVPENNVELLEEGDYLVTATFAPRRDRPFPPEGVKDATVGTIWRDGTTVNVPRLTTAPAYAQELIVVNRHRRLVDYALVVLPDAGGVAAPQVIPGKLDRSGPTRLRVPEFTTLSGTDEASAVLAIASLPNMIDVAATIVNQADGSTDTVILHRGLDDHGPDAPPPPPSDPNRTTVHVPLVTTAAGTNQRLTIVNRLFRNVSWALTVHPEGDVTATPAVIRGTVGPRAPTTLRIRDLVTLAGGNRAAATLVLAAKPAYIDVSTTLVNLADGATDAVILHRGIHGR